MAETMASVSYLDITVISPRDTPGTSDRSEEVLNEKYCSRGLEVSWDFLGLKTEMAKVSFLGTILWFTVKTYKLRNFIERGTFPMMSAILRLSANMPFFHLVHFRSHLLPPSFRVI